MLCLHTHSTQVFSLMLSNWPCAWLTTSHWFCLLYLLWGSSRCYQSLLYHHHIKPSSDPPNLHLTRGLVQLARVIGNTCIVWRQLQTVSVSQIRGCILWSPYLKANYIATPYEGCPNSKVHPNAGLLFPIFGGCTGTIRRGLWYPKILCTPKKERKKENVNIAWRRSSPSQAWLAEIMM